MYAGDLVRDFRGLDSVRSVAYSRARKTSHGKVHYLCRCRSVVFLGILLEKYGGRDERRLTV